MKGTERGRLTVTNYCTPNIIKNYFIEISRVGEGLTFDFRLIEFNEDMSNKIKNRTRDQRGYVMEPSSKPREQRTSKKYKQAKHKICRNNHSKKWSGTVT